MNSEPTYKINGKQRRILKKELSMLKSFVKNFWYHHQLDKDMTSIYVGGNGGNIEKAFDVKETYPMSDTSAQIKYDKAVADIKELEQKLTELYK